MLRRAITARQWIGRWFRWPGSISGCYWCRSLANPGRSWRNGAGPRWGGRTGTTAAESALRAQRFTTRVAARTGEWKTTRRPPVAWAALVSAVYAVLLPGGRKAAAGVGHGAAHLLQLVADARKHPGVRALQRTRGRGRGARRHRGTGEIEIEHSRKRPYTETVTLKN